MSFRVALVVCISTGGLLLGVSTAGAAGPLLAQGSGAQRSGNSEFSLSGVSCVSASECMAVGSYATSSGASAPFTEEWNGTSWSSVPVSAPQYSELSGVSCADSTDCMAVGSTRFGTLAESWDGSAWTILPSPAPKGQEDSELASVVCLSASLCRAVGFYANSKSNYETLAATWNGVKWVLAPSADHKDATGSQLFGLSCADADNCVAVGSSFNSVGNFRTLIETWNGTEWRSVTSPNEHPGSENTLNDVSCTSATNCIAVGNYFALSGDTLPLVEQWNGTSWAIVPAADHVGALVGLDCPKAGECTAVGWSSSGTLTETLSHSTWKVVPSPNPKSSGHSALFSAVACAEVKSCQAVGYYTGKASDTSYNLIESWNGHQWEIVKGAKPS